MESFNYYTPPRVVLQVQCLEKVTAAFIFRGQVTATLNAS